MVQLVALVGGKAKVKEAAGVVAGVGAAESKRLRAMMVVGIEFLAIVLRLGGGGPGRRRRQRANGGQEGVGKEAMEEDRFLVDKGTISFALAAVAFDWDGIQVAEVEARVVFVVFGAGASFEDEVVEQTADLHTGEVNGVLFGVS